jgi:EpsI family protein
MHLNKKYLLSFLFSLLMIVSLVLIKEKQKNIYNAAPPDLERIIGLCPDKWYPVKSEVTSPAWVTSAQSEYDMVKTRTYRNLDGQEITLVMTWGRNGIQKAGHVQQLCYSAQGFSIADQKNIEIPIKSRKMQITKFVANHVNGQVEDVYYWRITDGLLLDNIYITGFEDQRLSHRILRMRESLKYLFTHIPDNIMVRVTSRRSGSNSPSSAPVQYIKEYLECLSPEDLKLLTGI